MSSSSAISPTSSAQIQADYLHLLVTQLQNQDPMNPMDNSQMSSQLAQMSQLQEMENLNSSFSQVLQATQVNQASSLIGKQVSFIPDGQTEAVSGVVSGVAFNNGAVSLQVGPFAVSPNNLISITNPTVSTSAGAPKSAAGN